MVTRWIRGRLRARWNRYARTGDPRHLKGDQIHVMMCHLIVAGADEADSRLVSSVLAARGAHVVTPGERLVHAMQLSEITLLRLGVPPEEVPEHLEESFRQLTRGRQEEPEPAVARFEDREREAHAGSSERDRFLDDLAVEVAEGQVAELPPGHPDRPARLFQHAQALLWRFEAHAERADLEQAIALGREAVATVTADPARARARTVLAQAMRTRFQLSGDLDDLDESARQAREGHELAEPGSAEEIATLSHLDAALLLRHQRAGDPADLADAERHARRVLLLAGDGHPERAVFLSTLVAVLRTRFNHGGGDAILDEIVELAEEAVRRSPKVVPLWSRRLSALADALSLRYEVTGAFADLRETIAVQRAAVEDCPATHAEYPAYRFNLGVGLFTRYLRNGAAADLDEAVRACREAVERMPPGHVWRAAFEAHLAVILRARHTATGRREDLDEAIGLAARVVADLAEPNPRWAWTVSLLSLLHGSRYQSLGDPADLAEAVRLGRAALAATPYERRDRVVVVNNLVAVLLMGEADGDLAVELAREAAGREELGHESLSVLAAALMRQAQRTGEKALLDEASASLRAASRSASAPVSSRVDAALAWASLEIERKDWDTAATAATACAELLPLLAWRGLARQDQERHLVDVGSMARVGAACALSAGRPEAAVEILEQGRGVLLAQALDTRTDAAELAAAHPDLARRLDEVRRALDTLLVERPPSDVDDPSRDADRRQRLASRWDDLVTEIRALDGFHDFLRPLDAGRMKRTAAEGALIYLNVCELRSDALIVTPDEVRTLPLPGLTSDALYDNVADFLSVTALGDPTTSSARLLLNDVLAWLWKAVARPVLDELGHGPAQDQPRVWWLPTGPLAFLPLHAAGDGHDSVLDRVVSSYTPTIRSLDHMRDRPRTSTGPPTVVALPDQGLPNALREVTAVLDRFPGAQALVGAGATREAVLEALRHCGAVHFACHGDQAIESPSGAALVLHDDRLTVPDLSRMRLDRAEFAFLSACHTARPGLVLQEEAVHLAGALHLAGFRQVVGTLWAVLDPVAATISEQVYDRLATSGDGLIAADAAWALHDVLRHVRAAAPDQPHLWASHIHLGP
ncbi:CHAT domain-containing protein [Nonomuraea sp. NPDC050790]|uniref:CHAT domain-containing protein n=1 Tax=Nonomuraea sp. NPDC050790 TaxID=3364371 RepID=UPI0037BAD7BF